MPRMALAALLFALMGCTRQTTIITIEQPNNHHRPAVKAEFKFQ